jgi:preprotein translocase subunit SecG
VTILLVVLYVLVCLFLVLVVLLQQGKGADLAGAFGGGGSQTSFGPRSTANIMHRMTTASFVLFVLLSLALAILSGRQRSSVMEGVPVAPVGAANTATTPAVQPADDNAELPALEAPPADAGAMQPAAAATTGEALATATDTPPSEAPPVE